MKNHAERVWACDFIQTHDLLFRQSLRAGSQHGSVKTDFNSSDVPWPYKTRYARAATALVRSRAHRLRVGRSVGRATPPPLSEVQVIPLPGVERRIDHFAVDPAGKRLFVAALGNGTLEVLDVGTGKRIMSIGGLNESQGGAHLPLVHRIVVAMRGGAVAAFDDRTYRRTATLPSPARPGALVPRRIGSDGFKQPLCCAAGWLRIDTPHLLPSAVDGNIQSMRDFAALRRRSHAAISEMSVALSAIRTKHGSWLNAAEMEASLLSRQCLGKRHIPDRSTLVREVRAWRRVATREGMPIRWKFRVKDARRVFRYDRLRS